MAVSRAVLVVQAGVVTEVINLVKVVVGPEQQTLAAAVAGQEELRLARR